MIFRYTTSMKLGTDIIQISRIERLIEKYGDSFKRRYLHDEEINRAKSIETLAGLWAGKEAISKALGCGIGAELSFHDICIKKSSKGAPYFELSKEAQERHIVNESSISISHDGGFAIAVVAIN